MTIRGFLSSRVVRVLAILVIIGVLIHLTLTAIAAHRLSDVDGDIARQGLPMTPDQVIPSAPPQDNAAHDYEKAFVLLSLDGEVFYSEERSGKLSPSYEHLYELMNRTIETSQRKQLRKDFLDPGTWTAQEQDQAWAVLGADEFSRIRSQLITAAARSQCVFPLHYEDGPSVLLPMLQPMRQAAYLMMCHALLSQSHHQDTAMMDDFGCLLAMAGHCRQIPYLIANMVSASIETLSYQGLSIALSHLALGDTTAIESRTSGVDDFASAQIDFDAERVLMGSNVFGNAGKPFLLPMMPLYHGWLATPQRLYDHACYDHLMAQASIAMRSHQEIQSSPVPRLSVLTRMILPSVSIFNRSIERRHRVRAAASVAFALERARRDSHVYPLQLEDLVPRYLGADSLSALQGCRYSATADSWRLDADKNPDPATLVSRRINHHELIWESPRHR